MVFAIIPCRMGSSRFPGKVVESINEQPMFAHVYNAVVGCPWVDGVCVATDHFAVWEACYVGGIPCVMTPERATGSDRVYSAAALLGLKRGIVLNVQGDEPLITHRHIRQVLTLMEDRPEVNVTTLAYKLTQEQVESEDVVKVLFDGTGRICGFSRQQPLDAGVYYGAVGIMGFRIWALAEFARMEQTEGEKATNIELQRLIDNDFPVHCAVTDIPTIGVDRPEDIGRVERVLNEKQVR